MSWTCCCCEREYNDEDGYDQVDDDRYCEDCAESELGTCARCEEIVLDIDLEEIEDQDERWCPHCREYYAQECSECGHWYRETFETVDGDQVCQECRDEHFCHCESCQELFPNDRVMFNEDADQYFCESCGEDYENGSGEGRIHDHSYVPCLNFFRSEKDKAYCPLYFGVEVEMEARADVRPESVAGHIAEEDDQGLWFCKHDGSLSSQGVEVVSHPFTMEWMRENPAAFAPLFNRRGECLSYNTQTCGMHVHMSANAFTGLHLFKFATMFFHNPGFILLMSRRHPDRMNQWSACKLGKVKLSEVAAKKASNDYRYCALNFLPRYTVECRIFRGTLSPAGFYGNIEFLHGLYRFSKMVGIKDVTISKFSIFMRDNIKDYPNFAATLGNKLPISLERRGANVHSDLQASGEDD
jgi:hypothetical protein